MLRPSLLALVATAALAAPAAADDAVPWLGISFAGGAGPELAVTDVYPGTGAARAGLLPGDLIVAVDGRPLTGSNDLIERVRSRDVGGRVRVTVAREGDGDLRTLVVRLGPRPTTTELLEARLVGVSLPGLALVDLHGEPLTLEARPQVLVVFDARCEACGAAATALAGAIADDGLPVPLHAVVIGDDAAVGQYLRRVPVLAPVARSPVGPDGPRTPWLLSGVTATDEGAVLVVDGRGLIQFAASTADLAAVQAPALAAAARCERGKGRRR